MGKKLDGRSMVPRFRAIAFMMAGLAIIVQARIVYVGTVDRKYWTEVAGRLKRDSLDIQPARGDILSCDEQLMAGSLPEYKLYMDFVAGGERKDSLWRENLDSVCEGLHAIFPEKSASEFKADLEEGRRKRKRNWPIWRRRVSYSVYTQVKELPVLNLSPNSGGFHVEQFNARKRPFGTLARRTIGDIFGAKDTARCGLELSFDSILRGKAGKKNRQKVMNKYQDITIVEPTNGADIVTTIDVNIQDLAERAVIDELRLINGDVGVAIVMEVSTGDVKAIVNMTRDSGGGYSEQKNNAVSDLLEPGSVFKTASLMVALDDGVVDTTYVVDTGCGIWDMYGAKMRDHNWHRGGYQRISLPRTLEVSSNIGVSRIIDKFYADNPEKFVEGLDRIGMRVDLQLPIVGAAAPRIRMPEKNSHGQYTNWSKTALPWMSIGYETQVPPISMLTFYNAIANGGTMVKPRFVTRVVKDGEVLKEYPVEVIKPRICKEKTLSTIRTILEHVVSQGLGKAAGSKLFKVAGKTGTAQVSKGAGGYKSGAVRYLLSFAGYFPADAPRYSCIVCLQKSGLPASGGTMSGAVFRQIAEGIMAQDVKLDVSDARDDLSNPIPDVKAGNVLAADFVLRELGIATGRTWSGPSSGSGPVWGSARKTADGVELAPAGARAAGTVPDVRGMGAKDAVYVLESMGVRVSLEGRGKVAEQSLPAGSAINGGEACLLKLEI